MPGVVVTGSVPISLFNRHAIPTTTPTSPQALSARNLRALHRDQVRADAELIQQPIVYIAARARARTKPSLPAAITTDPTPNTDNLLHFSHRSPSQVLAPTVPAVHAAMETSAPLDHASLRTAATRTFAADNLVPPSTTTPASPAETTPRSLHITLRHVRQQLLYHLQVVLLPLLQPEITVPAPAARVFLVVAKSMHQSTSRVRNSVA